MELLRTPMRLPQLQEAVVPCTVGQQLCIPQFKQIAAVDVTESLMAGLPLLLADRSLNSKQILPWASSTPSSSLELCALMVGLAAAGAASNGLYFDEQQWEVSIPEEESDLPDRPMMILPIGWKDTIISN
eukprot:TRINITY_DN11437_c0_g3_i2.p1 TRINITY_DN11437_c0_g3~~TRINITY_DN11437_c0_g3_i2.p1  ORF type:complete len:130 (-),score=16.88 TRINITY_DN11437_c0_g3_i2:263-652(-)